MVPLWPWVAVVLRRVVWVCGIVSWLGVEVLLLSGVEGKNLWGLGLGFDGGETEGKGGQAAAKEEGGGTERMEETGKT
ncbi:Hypothetical predicted protein [Olea europaea subsp. europaea]|uniref:Uncharacterized protein n=1 Tax=Olea europaea subsp. europaea TaxID=158383 RepID=A0A8S0PHC0_OLEEU|nr:Hypothetical predicted protein [Olea europaea subsp. europaea]